MSRASKRAKIVALTGMPSPAPFDEIARLRTHIAWLGETARMGWWQTDALSSEGGGAMLAGFLAHTHLWAGIQVAWASAAVVETRLIEARGTVSLFRLGAEAEARLLAWLRGRKRKRAPLPDGLRPQPGPSIQGASAREALSSWGLLRRSDHRPVAGAHTFRLGQVRAQALATEDGLLEAVVRLAAGYEHGRASEPVVPYLELA